MPFNETVTIINNSGKILSTGKHLVNIFRDAKAAYREKKETLKLERSASAAGVPRSRTYDAVYSARSASGRATGPDYYELEGYDYPPDSRSAYHDGGIVYEDHPRLLPGGESRRPADAETGYGRRRSLDETASQASRASHRSRRSQRSSASRPPLTVTNLRVLSEVSGPARSTAPSQKGDRQASSSRPGLQAGPGSPTMIHSQAPHRAPTVAPTVTTATGPVDTPGQSMLVHRRRSDSALRLAEKEEDMHLAYGDMPPDLATRVDLDLAEPMEYCVEPDSMESPAQEPLPAVVQEQEARGLMERIEGLLNEAQCLHYTATAIISHLQGNPEAAAAVALTLAELSALLSKMGPAFLSILKGGSPAIFALLSSPQFLIGAGVAVGVTVVMFGGWKIVKRIQGSARAKEVPFGAQAQGQTPVPEAQTVYAPFPQQDAAWDGNEGFDEARVLDEELSSIESWRRGITAFGEDASADVELMTPGAESVMRDLHRRRSRHDKMSSYSSRTAREEECNGLSGDEDDDDISPMDSISHVGVQRPARGQLSHKGSSRSETGSRASGSHHSHASSRRHRHRRSSHSTARDDDGDSKSAVRDRKGSKGFKRGTSEAGASDRGSTTSHRSSKSGTTDSDSTVSRKSSKRERGFSDKGSRVSVKTVETASGGGKKRGGGSVIEDDASPKPKEKKEKKGSMLKALFKKKKDREDKDKKTEVSLVA